MANEISKLNFTSKINSFFNKNLSSSMFTHQEIFKMLAPLILDMFFINVINVLTTSMISSSSEESVVAVSIINPITTLILCLLNAIAAGGTVIVAQYKGRGNHNEIRESSGHTISVTVGISLIICLVMILFAKPLVNLLYGNADPLVIHKSIEYLVGVSISLIFFSLYSAIFAIFRGLGETKICLNLTIIINVSYFIFSYLFINLLNLDVFGTSLALILARLLGSLISVYYLFLRKNRLLQLSWGHIFHFNHEIFQSMLKISIPFASEQIFFYGGGIIVQKYLVDLGTTSMAANAIGVSLFGLSYAAPMAVANLSTTIIGQCVGANERELARWYGKKLVHLGTALVCISLIFFIPLMPWLLNFFNPTPETAPVVIRLMWYGIIPMPFVWSMSNIMPYVLRSAGDAVYSSVVSLITMWLVRVIAGYILAIPMGYGIDGVWICMSLEWVVRHFCFVIRYKGKQWLSKQTI